ncbi:MAG: MBL fold metallo-hydrolase [Candidatus Kaelpia aquatica]|nr:MBL fold metallo-hydrolase [Candidatus Kaelpia aquatica]
MNEVLDAIEWLSHASFRIEYEGKVIYIDPWRVKDLKPADLVLITHPHFDHFSEEDILKLIKNGTSVVLPKNIKSSSFEDANIITMAPYDYKDVAGFKIRAIPAYNVDKENHPKSSSWLGYLIEIGGLLIYHAGDTDLIPEMDDLNVDIALLPIGGTYTMDGREAACAAERVKAKTVIPMHYGDIVGSEQDLNIFKKNLSKDIELKVLS